MLNILHLPDLVGGHPGALSRAERQLGHASSTLSYIDSPFGYASDIRLKHGAAKAPLRWAERLQTFMKVRNRFDVYHFNFGSSLLNTSRGTMVLADLPFYRNKSAKFMTFQGSELRSTYRQELAKSLEMEKKLGNSQAIREFEASRDRFFQSRQKMLEKVYRHCDRIYVVNPDLLWQVPQEKTSFLPYAIELSEDELGGAAQAPNIKQPAVTNRPLHIVHGSTNRVLKGTGLIESALARAADDFGITHEIMVRESRNTFVEKVRAADLYIDQMVLGWYGAASVEAMLLGTPVICDLSERQLAAIPFADEVLSAFIPSSSDQLYATIKSIVENRDQLAGQAIAGYEFATTIHSPLAVARQVCSDYQSCLDNKG